ncbi:MAG: aminotransferase class V-fold PLP-dependent enzyme [Lysobacteraceae bacterium]
MNGQPLPNAVDGTRAFVIPERLLYLDTAAMGPPLRAVRKAANAALQQGPLSGFRIDWRDRVERVRALAAHLFDGDADGVALVPSAAYGLSVAARNVPLRPAEAVLVLEGQFPSNLLAWQQRCAQAGARLVIVRRDAQHEWTAAVLATLDADPAITVLALPNVYWLDGTVLDLASIAQSAHARGAFLVLDLSQSLGALPVDVATLRPDFVVAVGYKWLLGPYGLAYLWAAPRWRDSGTPLEYGWMAYDRDALWQPRQNTHAAPLPGARSFDADGVCDDMRLAMAEAALAQILTWSVPSIAAALGERIDAFIDAMRAHGLEAWLLPGEVTHFCALQPPQCLDMQWANTLATALRNEEVVFTLRHGRLRFAPHLHVSIAQMQALAARIVSFAATHKLSS